MVGVKGSTAVSFYPPRPGAAAHLRLLGLLSHSTEFEVFTALFPPGEGLTRSLARAGTIRQPTFEFSSTAHLLYNLAKYFFS